MTESEARSNIATNLRRALDDREMSVADLIEKTKVPHNTVYRMLRGDNQPSVAHLATICDALQVSMDKIVARPPDLVENSA